MNKIIFRFLFSAILLTGINIKAEAQTTNTAIQPIWGPTGYPQADYYYLPDLECYYSTALHQFIYFSGGRWVFSATLPSQYRNYDLYSGYKVVINKPRPYLNFPDDREKYKKFAHWTGKKQEAIRDSKGPRYKRQLKPSTKAKAQESKGDFGP